MTTYLCLFATLNFSLLVIIAVRQARREREVWDVLTIVKSWRESGRVQHKEASIAKDEFGAKVVAATAEVVHAIEEVPARVVELVKSDSGVMKSGGSPGGSSP